MVQEEHPFAQYIRIIGKGPRLSRPLTRDESYEAAKMILRDEIDPIQLGAFLCILRVRQEEPDEGAGFVEAVRDQLVLPTSIPEVDLDWPTFAGKIRQLPYYLLAALCLAESGVKIFMHGVEGHTPDRVYTSEVLAKLGISQSQSLDDAAQRLQTGNFAYIGLEHISPALQKIIGLKYILGLRSPVNTFARMINTFKAKHVFQCITHTAYREIHRDCADLLGDSMCVFKGEGGEIERRPAKPVSIQFLQKGQRFDEDWSAFLDSAHAAHDEEMDLNRLPEIWAGRDQAPYAEAAIIGTMAIALRLMERAANETDAHAKARELWAARNKDKIPYAQ